MTPEQEPVATLDDLEQEIYENTRQFVSHDVMEWMLKRYYTTPPQRKEPEQEQEPVACVQDLDEVKRKHLVYEKGMDWKDPLYTTPPQRTWVGLTDEEIADCAEKMEASDPTDSFWREFFRGIEAKLKEKNT